MTAAPPPESLARLIADKIEQRQYQQVEVFIAPQLPLNLLANAHKSWFKQSENERLIALIHSSFLNDAKEGVAFTDNRIIWEKIFQVPKSISYPELAEILNVQVLETIGDEEYHKNLEKLYSILNLFNNEYDKN